MPCKEEEDDSQISQNLNENLTEHEVVTETIVQNDSVIVKRIIERTRSRDSGFKIQDSKVTVKTEIVRDTVFVQRTDSVFVSNTNGTNPTNARASPLTSVLKWVFFIILGLIALIITAKLCLHR